MKVVTTRRPLPACFARNRHARGLVFEADIGLTPRARIKAKLLVFRHRRALRSFWSKALDGSIWNADAAVNALSYEVRTFPSDRGRALGEKERSSLVCDRRYFCLVGLARTHLGAELIMHESVHVGFAYAKRRRGDPWLRRHDLDEEEVAYPIGMAARGIVRALRRAKLIE